MGKTPYGIPLIIGLTCCREEVLPNRSVRQRAIDDADQGLEPNRKYSKHDDR